MPFFHSYTYLIDGTHESSEKVVIQVEDEDEDENENLHKREKSNSRNDGEVQIQITKHSSVPSHIA